MKIRDRELHRLKLYLNSLGIKVYFLNKKSKYTDAEWYTDGTRINVYNLNTRSKTQLILDLIHEGSHALHWISLGRKVDENIITALNAEDNRKNGQPSIDKDLRKLIYEDEQVATHYWDTIIKQVDIKISKDKIEYRKRLDLFQYRHYYETGSFPNKQERKDFKIQLKESHG